MNIHHVTKGMVAALLLASPLVGAGPADPKYPAADFEPVIITQNSELITKHSQSNKGEASSSVESSSSNYASPSSGTGTAVSSSPQKEESSMDIFPVVVVILALGGLVFWNTKKSGGTLQAQEIHVTPAPVASATSTETGVARYVKSLSDAAKAAAETGVARYIKNLPEKTPSTPATEAETGVAKYIKSIPEKVVAAAETGVSKYIKALPEKTVPETGVSKYLKKLDA